MYILYDAPSNCITTAWYDIEKLSWGGLLLYSVLCVHLKVQVLDGTRSFCNVSSSWAMLDPSLLNWSSLASFDKSSYWQDNQSISLKPQPYWKYELFQYYFRWIRPVYAHYLGCWATTWQHDWKVSVPRNESNPFRGWKIIQGYQKQLQVNWIISRSEKWLSSPPQAHGTWGSREESSCTLSHLQSSLYLYICECFSTSSRHQNPRSWSTGSLKASLRCL